MKSAVRNKLKESLIKLGFIDDDVPNSELMEEGLYDHILTSELPSVNTNNNTQPTENTDLKRVIDENKRGILTEELVIAFSKTILRTGSRELAFSPDKGVYEPIQPIRFPDSRYQLLDKETLIYLLKETNIDKIKYQKEVMDCEDIARALVQRCSDFGINSVGRVFSWSGGHSFNIAAVYNEDSEIEFVFIEPQTDQIITELTGQYDISNALMIIS